MRARARGILAEALERAERLARSSDRARAPGGSPRSRARSELIFDSRSAASRSISAICSRLVVRETRAGLRGCPRAPPHLLAREERVERRQRDAARSDRARAPSGRPRRRPPASAELGLVDLGHLGVERSRARRRLDASSMRRSEDADEIAPPLGAPVEASIAASASASGGIEREHVLVALRRVVDLAEPLVDRRRGASSTRARELRVADALRRSRCRCASSWSQASDCAGKRSSSARVSALRRIVLERATPARRTPAPRSLRLLAGGARDLAQQADALLDVVRRGGEDLERAGSASPSRRAPRRSPRGSPPPRRLRSASASIASSASARRVVARVEEQDLAVVLERAGGIAEVLLERRAEPVLEIDERGLARRRARCACRRTLDVRLPSSAGRRACRAPRAPARPSARRRGPAW